MFSMECVRRLRGLEIYLSANLDDHAMDCGVTQPLRSIC